MKSISVKNGFGIGLIIFAVAAIIALPLRTVQYFTTIEAETGFYSSVDWSVYLLAAVLAVAVIAILAFGIAKRKKLEYSLEVVKRPGCGVLSMACAAGILMSSARRIIDFMDLIEKNSQVVIHTAEAEASKSPAFVPCAEAIFGILSAMYLFALGFALLSGKTNGSEFRLISLSPVVWCIFRMISKFLNTISYIRVSDLAIEMIMIAFMILFFMAFAQVNSRVNSKGLDWKIAAYGLPAALLALVCFVPRFIVTVSGNSLLLSQYARVEYCDFGIALFIIATVATRVVDKIKAVPETAAEEKE